MEGNIFHILVTTAMFRPHEYLDPGSGSFLVQLLIGGLVAVGFGVRMFWGRIKTLFVRKSTSVETHTSTPEDNDITQ